MSAFLWRPPQVRRGSSEHVRDFLHRSVEASSGLLKAFSGQRKKSLVRRGNLFSEKASTGQRMPPQVRRGLDKSEESLTCLRRPPQVIEGLQRSVEASSDLWRLSSEFQEKLPQTCGSLLMTCGSFQNLEEILTGQRMPPQF